MAITESELNISNKSYTNKDFEAIYSELISKAKDLSKRFGYDPTASNESDPFVVLMKLLAFVGDKVNYNVDKNILERFLLSCTQERSMHELTETLGYDMHYYLAPTTEVVFTYDNFTSEVTTVTVPRFSTVLTSDTASNIKYVTWSEATIVKETGSSELVPVYEGSLKTLTLLDSDKVQLENLDSNNRVYFPEIMVAENGVKVEGGAIAENSWTQVTNLNTQSYGASVYKFAYDSRKKLPYLEFPEWIANIIGDGLSVYYVVTDGVTGNVAAKTLVSVTRNSASDSIDDSDIGVSNSSAANNGADPETIDEAYQGYKKTIGTFDTLVACRDYVNYIYNNFDDLTSNIQVADRRTDINYGCNVVTYTTTGQQIISVVDSTKITAYDLVNYPFKVLTNKNYTAIDSEGGYNYSYKYIGGSNTEEIKERLDALEIAAIPHDFKYLTDADIFSIRNDYKLDVIVTTTYKVTTIEEYDIIANIQNKLIEKYNPRTVNLGYEIAFDELLETIEQADSRIKSVSLQEPEQTPVIVLADNSEKPLYDQNVEATSWFKFIIAKDILSGKVSVFEYDERFNYKYTHKSSTIAENVTSVTTECNLEAIAAAGTYTLLNNEVIEFIAPNLITKVTYPYGVQYNLVLASGNYISKDSEYMLQEGDSILFYWKDSNDEVKTKEYAYDTTPGATTQPIISPNVDLYTTEYRRTHGETALEHIIEGQTKYFFMLGTTDEVSYKEINQEKLTTTKYCYWLVRDPNNTITFTQEGSNYVHILEANEYFFYTDAGFANLFSFGSGTKLVLNSAAFFPVGGGYVWKNSSKIDAEKIEEEGLDALRDVFQAMAFTSSDNLTIIENQLITLPASYSVRNDSSSSYTFTDNSFADVGKMSYQEPNSTEWISIPDRSTLTGAGWKARAILDINSGPDTAQYLAGKQTATYYVGTSTTGTTIIAGKYFNFNVLEQLSGGEKVDLQYLDLDTLTYKYPSIYYYEIASTTEVDTEILKVLDENHYTLNFSTGHATLTVNVPAIETPESTSEDPDYYDRYIMIFGSSLSSANSIKIKTDGTTASLINFNRSATAEREIELAAEGVYIIKITGSSPTLTISTDNTTTSKTVIISKCKVEFGLNPYLDLGLTDEDDFFAYMRTNFTNAFKACYITAELDKVKEIELSDSFGLSSAQAFYDYNNIANKWVIPKIDFANSNIKVARSSKK